MVVSITMSSRQGIEMVKVQNLTWLTGIEANTEKVNLIFTKIIPLILIIEAYNFVKGDLTAWWTSLKGS